MILLYGRCVTGWNSTFLINSWYGLFLLRNAFIKIHNVAIRFVLVCATITLKWQQTKSVSLFLCLSLFLSPSLPSYFFSNINFLSMYLSKFAFGGGGGVKLMMLRSDTWKFSITCSRRKFMDKSLLFDLLLSLKKTESERGNFQFK